MTTYLCIQGNIWPLHRGAMTLDELATWAAIWWYAGYAIADVSVVTV